MIALSSTQFIEDSAIAWLLLLEARGRTSAA